MGGSIGNVADKVSGGVKKIYSNGSSFAALKNDGTVVTWGLVIAGGSPSITQYKPNNVPYQQPLSNQLSGIVFVADSSSDEWLDLPAPPSISLSVSPATVTEDGTANLLYTFSRTGPTTNSLSVNYTVGGTATLGTDYTGIAATPARVPGSGVNPWGPQPRRSRG